MSDEGKHDILRRLKSVEGHVRGVERMVEEGRFREDLFYRLNVITIEIPPLRRRKEDVPLLAQHFLEKYGKENDKQNLELTPEAMRTIESHHWPGNVRELQHAVERAVIMCEGNRLVADDFLLIAAASPGEAVSFDSYNLEEVEREVISRVLRNHQGNVSSAARELGLTRTSLYRRMEKYGL